MSSRIDPVLARLHALASPKQRAEMARVGINPAQALGVSIYALRDLAKEIGFDHDRALALWQTGLHEARLLASFTMPAEEISEDEMEAWALDFATWDLTDQVSGLFETTPYSYTKAFEWSSRPEEFVKRSAFAIIAGLAVHDKKVPDDTLAAFFPVIERQSGDARPYVKKAVNWALRNLGKRNQYLNRRAIETAQAIARQESAPARWIAGDALRELQNEKLQARLARKAG